MADTNKVFVYGTLRRGFKLHAHLARLNARFLGKGHIGGYLYNLGRYPGAIPSKSHGKHIEGEVYELEAPTTQLRTLDEVEEFYPSLPDRSLFIRRRVMVRLEDGRKLKAWAYFLPMRPLNARVIRSGVYPRAQRARRA